MCFVSRLAQPNSKERTESLIQEGRNNGLNDNQIFSTLARRKDKVGIDLARAGEKMGSRGVADYFGLKLEAQDVNAAHNRDISKTQSRLCRHACLLMCASAHRLSTKVAHRYLAKEECNLMLLFDVRSLIKTILLIFKAIYKECQRRLSQSQRIYGKHL